MMYNKHYDVTERTLLYSGFIKPHPHIPVSIVRLGFANETDEKEISTLLTTASNDAIEIFKKISESFITEQASKMLKSVNVIETAVEEAVEESTNLLSGVVGGNGKKGQKKVKKNCLLI